MYSCRTSGLTRTELPIRTFLSFPDLIRRLTVRKLTFKISATWGTVRRAGMSVRWGRDILFPLSAQYGLRLLLRCLLCQKADQSHKGGMGATQVCSTRQ